MIAIKRSGERRYKFGVFEQHPPVFSVPHTTTTGFGNIPGSAGGAISLFYQFVLRGESEFTASGAPPAARPTDLGL